MKRLIFFALCLSCYDLVFAQTVYQLAPPMMKVKSVFFASKATVSLAFRLSGAQVRYTLNGKDPEATSPVYSGPVIITKSLTTFKARAFKKGFLPSETASATFIRDGIKIAECKFSKPNERFQGTGVGTLIDNKGGIARINNPGWLGYKDDSVEIVLKLKQIGNVSSVLIDMLQDHGSWVFLPEQIQVFYSDAKTREQKKFGEIAIPGDRVIPGAGCEYRIINAEKPVMTDSLTIRLHVLRSMPESHPGKGTSSWIFIDEIKVY